MFYYYRIASKIGRFAADIFRRAGRAGGSGGRGAPGLAPVLAAGDGRPHPYHVLEAPAGRAQGPMLTQLMAWWPFGGC
eukprot:scaffold2761_cov25-Prasinocladus_malaysianus.AAC.1